VGDRQRTAHGQYLVEFLEAPTSGLQAVRIADHLRVGEPRLHLGVLGFEGLDLIQHQAKASEGPRADPGGRPVG